MITVLVCMYLRLKREKGKRKKEKPDKVVNLREMSVADWLAFQLGRCCGVGNTQVKGPRSGLGKRAPAA